MDTPRICKECRQPLPENAPEGLCPACLAKVALGSEPAAPGVTLNINPLAAQAAPGVRVPPDVSQLAAQFPQLEILELLGMGGMGMVYKARQPNLDRIVALKILPKESAPHPSFAERFSREAKALAKLNHPGIVNVYDFGQTGEYYYFVMEYVDGMNLRALLNHQPVTPHQALELVVQICTALQFAHDEGVVHRDIKPENILITKKGKVKIADFGLAKLLGAAPDTALTMSQAAMGTMNYMAPEQRQNAQGVDHRADIYSLGVVFYEMLTGEVPMGRFEAPSKRVQVDVRLDEVVLRALEREPARRYQQASEVKSGVETITSTPQTPPAAMPASPGASQPAPLPRTRFYYSDLMAVVFFLLALYLTNVVWSFMPALGMLLLVAILLVTTFQLSLRRQIQKARDRGLWPQLGERATLEQVKDLAQAGERKLAFRLYRQIHGVSRRDAKAAVEKIASEVKSGVEAVPLARPSQDKGVRSPSTAPGFGPAGMGSAGEQADRESMGPRPARAATNMEPHFSRTAIVGVCFVPLSVIAAIAILAVAPPSIPTGDVALWQKEFRMGFGGMGLAAAFATTIFGWLALAQIQRSAGSIHGIWLALFDGLLLPLLALDFGIAFFVFQFGIALHFWTEDYNSTSNAIQIMCSLVAWPIVDWLIIRAVWRAVNKTDAKAPPVAAPPATAVSSQPRMAKTALFGAAWAFGFFLFALASLLVLALSHSPDGTRPETPFDAVRLLVFRWSIATAPYTPWWQTVLMITIMSAGLTAPFGTTILGYLSLSQIRHSTGRLYGRGLALFDALLFPMLLANALVFCLMLAIFLWKSHSSSDPSTPHPVSPASPMPLFVLAALILLALNILVVRKIWRSGRR